MALVLFDRCSWWWTLPQYAVDNMQRCVASTIWMIRHCTPSSSIAVCESSTVTHRDSSRVKRYFLFPASMSTLRSPTTDRWLSKMWASGCRAIFPVKLQQTHHRSLPPPNTSACK
uniref:Uncharacterized protein n=1 Tax=Anopheles melas TaxID=34690 RepID=A0A182TTQ4_9DIPT